MLLSFTLISELREYSRVGFFPRRYLFYLQELCVKSEKNYRKWNLLLRKYLRNTCDTSFYLTFKFSFKTTYKTSQITESFLSFIQAS